MKKGLLIIYSGPSGVGKDTILNEVMKDKELNLALSVSMTTRTPRNGDVEGKDYFFVTKEEFEDAIKNKELLEYAEYVGNYYGTPLKYVEDKRNEGYNVVLVIETEGAKKVLEQIHDNIITICIIPPSIQELENRIRLRNKDDEVSIAKRLEKAKIEIEKSKEYDHVIINDTLEQAIKDVKTVIQKEINLSQKN